MALASQTVKMMFRKKHVKRSLELIGAVAIVYRDIQKHLFKKIIKVFTFKNLFSNVFYLMLEILEAGNDAPIEAPRAGSKGKSSCPPGQMCGKYYKMFFVFYYSFTVF